MRRRYIRRYVLLLDFLLAAALIFRLAPNVRGAEGGPQVNVDVNALNNNSGSFAIGQSHTWIIRGEIPQWIGTARNYILTYEIHPSLTPEPGILVNLHTGNGRQLHLRAGEHYRLEKGTGGERLRLSLTPAGMTYAGANLEGKAELRISFRAGINTSARMGTTISGDARLTCTDSAGRIHEARSDCAEVHTGGIHISVTDSIRQPLEGAGFRLARLAADKERPDTQTELLYIDGKEVEVVFQSFYDGDSRQITEMVTDEEGSAQAYGLPYGVYYLVESRVPDRCTRLTQPVPVEISEVSHLTAADGWRNMDEELVDNTVRLVHTISILPEPAGREADFFAWLAISTAAAVCAVCMQRKRRSHPA